MAVESYRRTIDFVPGIRESYLDMLRENLDYFAEGDEDYEYIRTLLDKGINDVDFSEYDSTATNENFERNSILYHARKNIENTR